MKKLLLLLLLLFLAGLVLVLPVQGQTTGFVFERADATNTFGLTGSSTLNSLIANVVPRFVIEYANNKKIFPITPAPANLVTLLQQTAPRFVIEYANQKKAFPITPAPAGLVTLLQQVTPRIVIEYANAKKAFALTYPVALVNDTTPPNVTIQSATPGGAGQALITVTTNEYTTCTLEYGSAPGVYNHSLTDPLFSFTHRFIPTGLAVGAKIYYRFSLTDRSGNSAQSVEYSYTPPVLLYLPAVLQR